MAKVPQRYTWVDIISVTIPCSALLVSTVCEQCSIMLVFNCLHNLAPSYLSTMCQPVADNAGCRHLGSAARGDLAVPVTRTVRYGPRSFAVAGPSAWNSLPAPLRSCHIPSSFRRDLKTELFIGSYHQHARDCF